MKRGLMIALAAMPLFAAGAMAQAPQDALNKCLLIEDMTRERLDCYDKIVRPEAIQVLQQAAPKSVYDCRYIKEQDARLKCFNRFTQQAAAPAPAPAKRAAPKIQ